VPAKPEGKRDREKEVPLTTDQKRVGRSAKAVILDVGEEVRAGAESG